MTSDELAAKYSQASWLIARRSATAAGKAMMFSGESLDDTAREIAAIYGLGDEELSQVSVRSDGGIVTNIQEVAHNLLGPENDPGANQLVKLARTAVQNGTATAMVVSFLKAGPTAAQSVAARGAVMSKRTPWGWIATAAYAAGTASWFAYSARAINMEMYEFVRVRDGIEVAATPDEVIDADVLNAAAETRTLTSKVPTAAALVAQASDLAGKASGLVSGTFNGFFRRNVKGDSAPD